MGSLLYISRYTRPDMSNQVRELSKVMAKGTNKNFKQLIRLIKYVKNTRNHQLKLIPNQDNEYWSLNGYSDSDWEGDENDRKSVSGWVVMLNGAIIFWGSRK